MHVTIFYWCSKHKSTAGISPHNIMHAPYKFGINNVEVCMHTCTCFCCFVFHAMACGKTIPEDLHWISSINITESWFMWQKLLFEIVLVVMPFFKNIQCYELVIFHSCCFVSVAMFLCVGRLDVMSPCLRTYGHWCCLGIGHRLMHAWMFITHPLAPFSLFFFFFSTHLLDLLYWHPCTFQTYFTLTVGYEDCEEYHANPKS